MERRRGFTLIELLVVVAIIALLIAILLPSLGKARDNAKKTLCASRLHALTQGAVVYSADWDNRMPPVREQGTSGYQASMTYQMNNGSTLYGFALLFKTKSITDPRVYYCPSQLNPTFQLDSSAAARGDDWLKLSKDADGGGRMGFHYQLHTTGTDTKNREVAYTKFTQFPKNAIVAVDNIWGPDYIAHGSKDKPGSTYFNASFIDGHAETIYSPDAVKTVGSTWAKLDATVNALEKKSAL